MFSEILADFGVFVSKCVLIKGTFSRDSSVFAQQFSQKNNNMFLSHVLPIGHLTSMPSQSDGSPALSHVQKQTEGYIDLEW